MRQTYKELKIKVYAFSEDDVVTTSTEKERTFKDTWFDGYGDSWENQ